MKQLAPKRSLYVILGITIVMVVTVILSLRAFYHYADLKSRMIDDMKRDSTLSIVALHKNIIGLVSAYAINEYEDLIVNEMDRRDHFSIVVEDYNMGRILGRKAYVSGKIRDANGMLTDFNIEDSDQVKLLDNCYYFVTNNLINASGKKIGKVTIYISDASMDKALGKIITEAINNLVIISLLLIVSLLVAIRSFILKPISNIADSIKDADEDGLPIKLVAGGFSVEISSLALIINNMVDTIKSSRRTLIEQHNELETQKDQLLTLSMATEQSPVSIIICDSDNKIEYINPEFERISGFGANEIIGRFIEAGFQYGEIDKSRVDDLHSTLRLGKKWVGELHPFNKSGDQYNIRLAASPIFLGNGSVGHYIYVAEDITEHKRNEEMLRNSQKMDAVGQLTGGIAHDFNNILGIIMGNLELLKDDVGQRPKELERIEKALAGVIRGAQLTRKLLNFSRHDYKEQKTVKINHFIDNLRELIAKSVTVAIHVETHLAEDLWSVNIDPGELEDAVLNLSLNARDAMPNGGVLTIETANRSFDLEYVKHNPGINIGDYVMISVSDNGHGIKVKDRKKIFDPFFSTKEFGKGTGLGLSMVYGFVQRSGGDIKVYSEEGSGSSFHIYLPRVLNEDEEEEQEQDKELPRGDELVLIVDDEEDLVQIAEDYLQGLGYRTMVASNAQQALSILSSIENIDLLFSDVVMPKTSGFELALAALKQNPSGELNVLLTSGFSSKHMTLTNGDQKTYLKLYNSLLRKPYNLSELATAVRGALDKK